LNCLAVNHKVAETHSLHVGSTEVSGVGIADLNRGAWLTLFTTITLGTSIALQTAVTLQTSGTLRANITFQTALTHKSLGATIAGSSGRTRRPALANRTLRSGFSTFALQSLRADFTPFALRPTITDRSNFTAITR
jgi:hypothetical protein